MGDNGDGYKHAKFSIGIIDGIKCREMHNHYGSVFNIRNSKTYNDAYYTQQHFYDYFFESSYDMKDVMSCIDKFQLPYMDSSKNQIVIYGSEKNPKIISPIT